MTFTDVLRQPGHVPCASGGLRTIDVTIPEEPVEIRSLATQAETRGVAVVGDVAYLADG